MIYNHLNIIVFWLRLNEILMNSSLTTQVRSQYDHNLSFDLRKTYVNILKEHTVSYFTLL